MKAPIANRRSRSRGSGLSDTRRLLVHLALEVGKSRHARIARRAGHGDERVQPLAAPGDGELSGLRGANVWRASRSERTKGVFDEPSCRAPRLAPTARRTRASRPRALGRACLRCPSRFLPRCEATLFLLAREGGADSLSGLRSVRTGVVRFEWHRARDARSAPELCLSTSIGPVASREVQLWSISPGRLGGCAGSSSFYRRKSVASTLYEQSRIGDPQRGTNCQPAVAWKVRRVASRLTLADVANERGVGSGAQNQRTRHVCRQIPLSDKESVFSPKRVAHGRRCGLEATNST